MTKDEIIYSLEDQAQDKESLANNEADSIFTRDALALRAAAALLRGQTTRLDRRRWEGCEMCNKKYTPPEWNGGGSHVFRVDKNALFYHDSKYGWEGIEVKFCPMCSKPLTEEGWAELGKRIGESKVIS